MVYLGNGLNWKVDRSGRKWPGECIVWDEFDLIDEGKK